MIPHSEKNNEKYESYKMLFDFQSNAVFNTLIKIKNPFTRALIQMPTGTGKTRTAVDIMIRLLKQKNESLQIIWFANKSELLDQAYEAFENAWGHVGNEKINIIKFWGEESMPKIPKGKCVYFVGYQKFRSLKSNIKSKIKPDYIFVDEAHQILAKTYEDTIDSLIDTQKSTRLVGLTATPGRGLSDVQNERLTDKFNDAIIPLEIFDKEREEAYEGNIIQYLEDEKILAKAIGKKLFSDFEYELTPDEWRHLQELHKGDYPEFSSQFFKKLTNDNIRNTLIIDELKKYAEEGKKILYFSTDIDQAKLVYVALQKLNISAVYVNEETDKKFRKQIIKTFKETDEISVICNFNIFSTGFDVPDLDVIFIGRPINSPVLFNQIVGRGTRGEKMGAKKSSFLLVQVIDKIQSRFHDFDPYAQYGFWDKYWKK